MGFFGWTASRRLTAILSLVVAFLAIGAVFALLPTSSSSPAPTSGLPASAESAKVSKLLESSPQAGTTVGILVYTHGDQKLSDSDRSAIAASATRLAKVSTVPQAVRPQFADDGRAALVTVPVSADKVKNDAGAVADKLRSAARDGLPSGVQARLTGPVGFQADITGAFAGADLRLLLVTALVVAVLLIVTYRSPILWIVPLLVVGAADGVARQLVSVLADLANVTVDASVSGIQSVLVFGAGTNYALLIVSRYREELLREQNRFVAMRRAMTHAGPAVLASGGTVTVALLLLLLGRLQGTQALGFACAIGIVVALIFGLLVLPAALVLCGRGVFWPFVPRADADSTHRSVWGRIGEGVARRPLRIAAGAVVLLGVLSAGLVGARVGLAQIDQFVGNPESVQAQRVVDDAFPAGLTASTTVLAPTSVADRVETIVRDTSGVQSVTRGPSWDGRQELDVTLTSAPQSDGAYATIRDLRSQFADQGGAAARTLVGGTDATALDVADISRGDQMLILPLIIAVVFAFLAVLLRSLVAPVVLIATVLATFAASVGASNWLFQNVLGFPAFDTSVLLFGFLFLVALGVDYNIFLTSRAREERRTRSTRDAIVAALSSTGAVITSAGILLAAVFVVLGVLPVVALAQVGTIVCLGVLLDTLVVRTILVPALVVRLGDRFWWPGRLPHEHGRHAPADAPEVPAVSGPGAASGGRPAR